jgi:hypothetical protein
MPGGTAPSADDSTRQSSPAHSPPITPALKAELPKLNPEIAAKVRDVVKRKS